jgi:antibiotic biosynthesis monooxygenase (ABM) superfamily enzyme
LKIQALISLTPSKIQQSLAIMTMMVIWIFYLPETQDLKKLLLFMTIPPVFFLKTLISVSKIVFMAIQYSETTTMMAIWIFSTPERTAVISRLQQFIAIISTHPIHYLQSQPA